MKSKALRCETKITLNSGVRKGAVCSWDSGKDRLVGARSLLEEHGGQKIKNSNKKYDLPRRDLNPGRPRDRRKC